MPAALSATRRLPSSSYSAARSPSFSVTRCRSVAWRRARGARGHAATDRPAHTYEAKASAQRVSACVQAALPHLLLLLHQRTAPRLAARQQSQLQIFCPQQGGHPMRPPRPPMRPPLHAPHHQRSSQRRSAPPHVASQMCHVLCKLRVTAGGAPSSPHMQDELRIFFVSPLLLFTSFS